MKKLIKNILTLVLGIMLVSIFYEKNALAATPPLDEKYDWASGYKFRSQDSIDNKDTFKSQSISGGGFYQNVPLYATFPMSKATWDPDNLPSCITKNDPTLTCSAIGTFTKKIVWTFNCLGDVEMDMDTTTNLKNFVGGDTMYGAWSMLFNFFPPSYDTETCSEFGKCYVGNTYIQDTKAQKEDTLGRFWGLGEKVGGKDVVEGPGDVFYFDQVRAMTQPPIDTREDYNNPYLLGDAVQGNSPASPVPARCALPDFSKYNTQVECGICGSPFPPDHGGGPIIGNLARKILWAAGEAKNVPAAVIWSAMMHEGGNWGDTFDFNDANVTAWSLPVGCPGYKPMPLCDDTIVGGPPPFGVTAYEFAEKWDAVRVVDLNRSSIEKVSRCNFMDAAFVAAEILWENSSMHVGTHCDGCGRTGPYFTAVRAGTCSRSFWTPEKIIQANVAYMNICPSGDSVQEYLCSKPSTQYAANVTWGPDRFTTFSVPYQCH